MCCTCIVTVTRTAVYWKGGQIGNVCTWKAHVFYGPQNQYSIDFVGVSLLSSKLAKCVLNQCGMYPISTVSHCLVHVFKSTK